MMSGSVHLCERICIIVMYNSRQICCLASGMGKDSLDASKEHENFPNKNKGQKDVLQCRILTEKTWEFRRQS